MTHSNRYVILEQGMRHGNPGRSRILGTYSPENVAVLTTSVVWRADQQTRASLPARDQCACEVAVALDPKMSNGGRLGVAWLTLHKEKAPIERHHSCARLWRFPDKSVGVSETLGRESLMRKGAGARTGRTTR